jgi:hypothetical protein
MKTVLVGYAVRSRGKTAGLDSRDKQSGGE